MSEGNPAGSTAIFPADRAWDHEGRGSPHVGVLVGGPAATSQHVEYLTLIFGLQMLGSFAAVWWIFTHSTGWVEWSAFASGYVIINFGLSVGFHRYFSHRSFETSKVMRAILAITGQMASIGSVINWSADHRRHHAFTNVPGDPYAPRVDGHGRPLKKNAWGFFMVHIGWLLDNTHTDLAVYGKGLADDPILVFVHRTRYFWAIFSIILLPAGWALLFGGPEHVIGTVLIGGCLRTFIFANGVAFTNSLAHDYGYQNFPNKDGSVNNWFVALLTFGDGWHNNHHDAPRVASNHVRWWEFDINGWTIHAMEKLGLAWNVQRRAKARAAQQPEGA